MSIIRIVRLSFEPAHVDAFLAIYQEKKSAILAFEGCRHLQLKRDYDCPNVYYTYSYWDSNLNLENYRASEFFGQTWSQTKILFNNKPQAFTLIDTEE
jgi:heme oxygenase (mycobilin-producing)